MAATSLHNVGVAFEEVSAAWAFGATALAPRVFSVPVKQRMAQRTKFKERTITDRKWHRTNGTATLN